MSGGDHLVRIHLAKGAPIDMHREAGDVRVCRQNHCVVLKDASAQQTLDLLDLLESVGESVDFPGEETQVGPSDGGQQDKNLPG